MNSVRHMTQAYSQAPWRKQLQLIGLFLLILIVGALVAGIYLNVSARAAIVGRTIQGMRAEIERVKRENADLETRRAFITSNEEMERRAQDLGFRPLEEGEQVLYIIVPGYTGRQSARKVSLAGPTMPVKPLLPLDYTQSLLDWLRERVFDPAAPLLERNP